MGEPGVPARLLASRYGSRWTFAGKAVAPGQMLASRMLDAFRFRAVGPSTRLFGVVSRTAMHSLSPVMHNAAFAAAGIDAVYVPLTTDDFGDFLAYADAMGFEGASVTIPFKLDALEAAAVKAPIAAGTNVAQADRNAAIRSVPASSPATARRSASAARAAPGARCSTDCPCSSRRPSGSSNGGGGSGPSPASCGRRHLPPWDEHQRRTRRPRRLEREKLMQESHVVWCAVQDVYARAKRGQSGTVRAGRSPHARRSGAEPR
jgi:hypothetical protein